MRLFLYTLLYLGFISSVNYLNAQSEIIAEGGMVFTIGLPETSETDPTKLIYPVHVIGHEERSAWTMGIYLPSGAGQTAASEFIPNSSLPNNIDFNPGFSGGNTISFGFQHATDSLFTLSDYQLIGHIHSRFTEYEIGSPRRTFARLTTFSDQSDNPSVALLHLGAYEGNESLGDSIERVEFIIDCADERDIGLVLHFSPHLDSINHFSTGSTQPIDVTEGLHFAADPDNGGWGHQSIRTFANNDLAIVSGRVFSDFRITEISSPHLAFGNCEVEPSGNIWLDVSELDSSYLPVQVLWLDGDTNLHRQNMFDGYHGYQLTAANGCSLVNSVRVAESSVFHFTTQQEECNQGTGAISTTLIGDVEDYSIEWSTGDTTLDLSGLSAGTYTVTVTNSDGCTEISAHQIDNVAPQIQLFHTYEWNTNDCHIVDSIRFHILLSTIDSIHLPLQIIWGNGDTSLTTVTDGLQTIGYEITTAGGCTVYGQTYLLSANESPFYFQSISPGCVPDDGSIRAISDEPDAYTYDWSNGESSPFNQNLIAGIYQVEITEIATGCKTTFSVDVPHSNSISVDFDSYCDTLNDSQLIRAYPNNTESSTLMTYVWSNGSIDVNVPYSSVEITGDSSLSLNVYKNDCQSVYPDVVWVNDDCEQDVSGAFGLNIGHVIASPNETQICVPVVADSLPGVAISILGFNGEISFDTSQLDFLGLVSDLSPEWFIDANEITPGVLRIVGYDVDFTAVSLTYATFFSLCFSPKTDQCFSLIEPIPGYWEFIDDELNFALPIITPGSVAIGETDIWPGDANANGTVNHFDILNIGLANTFAGPERENASLNWQSQPVQAWQDLIPTTNLNAAHADTDGSGLVAHEDQIAIDTNWTQTTDWYDPELDLDVNFPIQSPFGPPLFIQPDTVQTASTATFEVHLGTDERPAEDIYGLAFSVEFDDFVVDAESTITFDANESWLGEAGVDLIFTYRVFPEEEKIDIGITRTDGQAMDGIGQIGQLNVTIEDVIFFNDVHFFDFEIGQQKLLNEASISLPSNAMTTTSAIIDLGISRVNDLKAPYAISIFPNPTRDRVHFDISGLNPELLGIQAVDLNGREVNRWSNLVIEDQILSVQSWPSGVYFLRFQFSDGVITKRIVIK